MRTIWWSRLLELVPDFSEVQEKIEVAAWELWWETRQLAKRLRVGRRV